MMIFHYGPSIFPPQDPKFSQIRANIEKIIKNLIFFITFFLAGKSDKIWATSSKVINLLQKVIKKGMMETYNFQ